MLGIKNKYLDVFKIVLIWILIGMGVLLRSYKADLFPIDNNDDGLYYVWAGNSFITNPLAVQSHSIFDSGNTSLFWRSQYYDYVPHLRFGMKIVQPWFDHPPLGSFFIALPAHFLGYTNIEQIPHLIVRYPAIIASIFTLLFTYLIAKKVFTHQIALFSLLSLATVPYFVFAHRQAYLENMLTPIFLLSTLSYLYYEDNKNRKWLLVSAVMAFMCGWIKIPAFSIPLIFAGWSLYKKNWFTFKVFLLTFLASFLSYFIYGLASDRSFFLETITNQGVRGMYLSSFLETFIKPQFYGDFKDGLYVLSILCTFILLVKKEKSEKEQFLSWVFLGFSFVLFLVCGKYNNSFWYKNPLIPFLSIGLGYALNELYQNKNIFYAVLFILFGLTSYDLAGIELSSNILRLSTIFIFAPFVLLFIFPKNIYTKKIANISFFVLVCTIVLGNLLAIKNYPLIRCQNEPCLLPTKIILEKN